MNDEKCKELLRLLDAQNILTGGGHADELHGRLQAGMGMAGELGAPYSYDTDEEQTAQDAHSKD